MNNRLDSKLYQEVAEFGARDMEACMQCGTCSAACPLSGGTHPFPRKIYRYLQLGLRDKLLGAPEPWLCYYCGECNQDCPRKAEPAETMMAVRRWLTAQYDWTGLARRFYLSEAWEIGALAAVALIVVLLFVLAHGPIVTARVAVNSFAPVKWIELGDLAMAAVLTFFLLTNAFRMYRFIMGDTHPPLWLYMAEAKAFALNFVTQSRWRQCGEDRSRWLKHFILVTGYLTMMALVIVFIRWFQVDDDSWHFTSIFGYYATGVLLVVTGEMFRSRQRKAENLHRFSEFSDWLFLVLLFFTALSGIAMHAVRMAGWPLTTYLLYVVHLAIAVPMLIVEVPFGKWSHLFYRPLAIFLSTVKEKAAKASRIEIADVIAQAGRNFMTCLQCGTCNGVCPLSRIAAYSPRRILRQLALGSGSEQGLDQAVWSCVTCKACETDCPRGIGIIDIVQSVRSQNVSMKKLPAPFKAPLASLESDGNPWGGLRRERTRWAAGTDLPALAPDADYCLFTCCTTAYDPQGARTGLALLQLLKIAGVSFGTLGSGENCCGDQAEKIGAAQISAELARKNTELFLAAGARRILTASPHCLNAFKNTYAGLKGLAAIEHHTELLECLIAEGRLAPIHAIERIVTYHDPCYLGRGNGIYEVPRRILKSIPGLTLIELAENREGSLCCGGGGGGGFRFDADNRRLGISRVEAALALGAEVIATACPYCLRMLTDAVRGLGAENRIVVADVSELLLQSVAGNALAQGVPSVYLKSEQEVGNV